MSDARLRELERRFQASGQLADEVAWLIERLRAGVLREERLRQAAHVGHAAARAVLGEGSAPPLPASERWHDMHPWARAFRAWDRPAALRVALAAVETAWRRWEPRFTPANGDAIRAWLRAGRECAECPCPAHERAARQAADRLVVPDEVPPGGGYVLDAAGSVARLAAGEPFWVGCIANSRRGPDGALIAPEMMAAIRDQAGGWLLYGEPG